MKTNAFLTINMKVFIYNKKHAIKILIIFLFNKNLQFNSFENLVYIMLNVYFIFN